MTDRAREINRRINLRYLSAPQAREAMRQDAQFHAELRRIQALLSATESAMDAEGIAEEVRDRVIYRLLYGEAPDGYTAPDWQGAPRRAAEREAAIVDRMQASPFISDRMETP